MILEDDEHEQILCEVDNRVVKFKTFLVACRRFHEAVVATAVTASQHAALEDILVLVLVRHAVERRRAVKNVIEVDTIAIFHS